MEKTRNCEYFEHLLWQNELEYNRRELAIFESFLINNVARIPAPQYQDFMSQLHDFLRKINLILAEFSAEKKSIEERMALRPKSDLPGKSSQKGIAKECMRYLREEMFYYEQNYRGFRTRFCGLAGALEHA